MPKIMDLDKLFPEKGNEIKFTGSMDGKEYKIRMFIPHGFSLFWLQNSKKKIEDRQLDMLEMFLTKQYQHMDKDWIKDNISLQRQNVILGELIKEINRSNSFLAEDGMEEKIMEMAEKILKKDLAQEEQNH